MSHRCYSATPITGDAVDGQHVELDGSEAHHLLHVLRATPGMQVTLFDGSNCEFDAEVTVCGRSTVELTVHDCRLEDRELPLPLTLGVPMPKGDRQRWIVEKAVELGVTRLAPLRTERSVATGDKAGDKLDRYVIEASKQCGRNRLMEIAAPQSWNDWLTAAVSNTRRWVADLTGRPLTVDELRAAGTCAALAAVGPEGGLTDAELAAARNAGWEVISLGPRILRIETAALTLAALLASPGGRSSS